MPRFLEKFFALALLAALVGATGCGAGDESRWPRLVALVAEEARPYTRELGPSLNDYKQRMGVAVAFEYAPTAQIAERLARTPAPDLVVLCDPALARTLGERGLVNPKRWLMERTRDRIAVVTRPEGAPAIGRLEDLTRPDVRRVGVTEFYKSDVGTATDMYLRRVKLMTALDPKLTYYPDQASLARAVESGEVQAGLMRESFAARQGVGRLKTALAVDPQDGTAPPYVALAVCEGSAQAAAAHQAFGQFEAFFRTPETLMIDAHPGQGNMITLDNTAS